MGYITCKKSTTYRSTSGTATFVIILLTDKIHFEIQMLIIAFVASLSWADNVQFVVNIHSYVRLVTILLTKSVRKEIKQSLKQIPIYQKSGDCKACSLYDWSARVSKVNDFKADKWESNEYWGHKNSQYFYDVSLVCIYNSNICCNASYHACYFTFHA